MDYFDVAVDLARAADQDIREGRMGKRAHFVNDPDASELWREYRRAQQERRASRLGPRTDEILALQAKGYHVQPLTPYQFRIDSRLDLYPIHRRYHHLPTEHRGGYQNALACAVRFLRGGKAATA